MRVGASDVYLNVAGRAQNCRTRGLTWAVAAALLSSMSGRGFGTQTRSTLERSGPIGCGPGWFGLSSARMREAERLGFARAIAPKAVADSGAPIGIDCRGRLPTCSSW